MLSGRLEGVRDKGAGKAVRTCQDLSPGGDAKTVGGTRGPQFLNLGRQRRVLGGHDVRQGHV
ncbi:hypothetical protein [Streptomyces sp. NPDC008137]|uniref:hypothetical protein n=1 Tax=Streptomyces sp. NPDC008137 TaxID=3364813 RepID=UPI0036EE69F6